MMIVILFLKKKEKNHRQLLSTRIDVNRSRSRDRNYVCLHQLIERVHVTINMRRKTKGKEKRDAASTRVEYKSGREKIGKEKKRVNNHTVTLCV